MKHRITFILLTLFFAYQVCFAQTDSTVSPLPATSFFSHKNPELAQRFYEWERHEETVGYFGLSRSYAKNLYALPQHQEKVALIGHYGSQIAQDEFRDEIDLLETHLNRIGGRDSSSAFKEGDVSSNLEGSTQNYPLSVRVRGTSSVISLFTPYLSTKVAISLSSGVVVETNLLNLPSLGFQSKVNYQPSHQNVTLKNHIDIQENVGAELSRKIYTAPSSHGAPYEDRLEIIFSRRF